TQLCMRLAADGFEGAERGFAAVVSAKASTSALQAIEMGILSKSTQIVFNRDRLLAAARATALRLAEKGYSSPATRKAQLGGKPAADTLLSGIEPLRAEGRLTANDDIIAKELAHIFT